jgi:protocatechuate 3,4-dioxygenase beta subunit
MNRKDFLRGLGLVGIGSLAIPVINACSKDDDNSSGTATDTVVATDTGSSSSSSSGSTSGSCSVTTSETDGPFPTKSPSSLVKSNIIMDRTGVGFTINITIKNTNASCAALKGAIVDIWHCDKDGYYSEYGGISMQTVDYTGSAYHFLRGRQNTDDNGLVTFTSIFPGWYTSRATHIHVHIYNASGTSLLVTQIAFPEGSGTAVALVNASTANGYTKGLTGYTYNASDTVFSDSVANEMSTVTGSVAAGFVLAHTINVAG